MLQQTRKTLKTTRGIFNTQKGERIFALFKLKIWKRGGPQADTWAINRIKVFDPVLGCPWSRPGVEQKRSWILTQWTFDLCLRQKSCLYIPKFFPLGSWWANFLFRGLDLFQMGKKWKGECKTHNTQFFPQQRFVSKQIWRGKKAASFCILWEIRGGRVK